LQNLSWVFLTFANLPLLALLGNVLFSYIELKGCVDRSRGFEDNLQTYGLMAGMFQSGFCLGGFVGPSAAGYFTGQFGFEWATSVCGFISIFLVSGWCEL